jgi:hypothetical protein
MLPTLRPSSAVKHMDAFLAVVPSPKLFPPRALKKNETT